MVDNFYDDFMWPFYSAGFFDPGLLAYEFFISLLYPLLPWKLCGLASRFWSAFWCLMISSSGGATFISIGDPGFLVIMNF